MPAALTAWIAIWFYLTPLWRGLHIAASLLALGTVGAIVWVFVRGLASIIGGCP